MGVDSARMGAASTALSAAASATFSASEMASATGASGFESTAGEGSGIQGEVPTTRIAEGLWLLCSAEGVAAATERATAARSSAAARATFASSLIAAAASSASFWPCSSAGVWLEVEEVLVAVPSGRSKCGTGGGVWRRRKRIAA